MISSKKGAGRLRLLIASVLAAVICVGFTAVHAAEYDTPAENRIVVFIGGGTGQDVSFTAELYDSTSYVSVADFAAVMGATGVRNGGGSVSVTAPGLELQAVSGDSYIVANGTYIYAPTKVRTVNGEIVAPLRPLAEAFGASVVWSNSFRAVFLTRGGDPFNSPSVSQDDVFWMARIIYAEAGNESFEGKIAVGNVVMNRVHNPQFPNTVYNVIFDRRYGTIQFTPAATGAIYNSPSRDCLAAANIALTEGADIVGDSLYFASTAKCWAAKNRPSYGSVGNHTFYL